MRTLLVVGVWILIGSSLLAQCPVTDFASPSLACSGQNIYVQNLTVGAASYEWDFCSGDLALTPSASIAASSNLLFRTRSMRVAHDSNSNLWYGFTIDQANSPYKLIRFNFGNSLSNDPSVVDLGNPSNVLNSAFDLQLHKEGSNWYGLVANTGTNSLLLLSFGTDLGSTPIVQNLGSFGVLDTPDGIFLAVENGMLSVFITNGGSVSEIVKLTFGSSILNAPTISSFPVAGGSALRGIAMIRECDRWFGLVISYGNGKVFWLDFTNGLSQSPQSGEITFFTSYNFPTNIALGLDGSEYFAFIQSALGEQYRLSFGSSIIDKAGTGQNLGNFGISNENSALELVKVKSDWFGFSIDLTNRKLVRQTFPAMCDASTAISTGQNPSQLSFAASGTKKISLTGISSDGAISSQSKAITISPSIAPDIAFTSANVCANNNVNFTAQNTSGNITSYAWSFGDTNTSPLTNPSNIYATGGTYTVALQVTATNGCINIAKSDVAIYDQPIADFALPSASPFCTNQNYVFTNQSTFDPASSPTWEWLLNGTLVSSTQNLAQAFATSTAQEIRLKAKIPGCENEIIKNVNTVLPGPLTNFSFASGCQDSPVAFTNTTSGTITSYLWTFGDGNTSSSTNASNTYADIGSYNVTLQANNAAGCQNALTKSITIYTKPQPDFSLGLPPFSCAGTASQFTDQTPSPTDSNITTWTWGFGDAANGSSLVKNPSYTYATANTYNVSLAVATNFGCTNSIQKVVTISPSPVAGFSNLPACVNQATQFTDASSGSIKSRLWQIQSSTFTTPNPQFIFPSAGSFPVVLTVTGNNNCVSQASKNIVVPVVPSLDFSVQAPCANSPTVFTELTTSVDPSISKSWSFGSQGTGSGSPVQYTFSSTGTYVVQLNSTRQSGCVYSVSKNVSIVTPPVADFVPSIDAGAAPLPVSFTNNSSGANSYLWKFGDLGNSTSVLISPTFVFSELGSYNVELSASNSVGCTNRLSKPISVVIPNVDAEMTDFFFVKEPKTGSLQPVVKLLNRSNITLTNPIILLDVAGGSGVSQQLTGIIKPNQEISQMLDLKLVSKTNQYVCAEVVVVGDTDTFLNRRCLSLSGEEVLFAPFPNPAREQLNMDWISIDGSAVTFQVLTSAGAVSFQQTISSINPGLNRLVINTSTLLSGTYFIRFRDRTNDRTFSLVVLGN